MRACTCPSTTRSQAGRPTAGRQPPFIARTIPLRVDRGRIALHAARQPERGGRHLADLRQPHWQRRGDRDRPTRSAARARRRAAREQRGAARRRRAVCPANARPPIERRCALSGAHAARHAGASYRELVELDLAQACAGPGGRARRRRSSPISATWRCWSWSRNSRTCSAVSCTVAATRLGRSRRPSGGSSDCRTLG